jgi:hypothetical protein
VTARQGIRGGTGFTQGGEKYFVMPATWNISYKEILRSLHFLRMTGGAVAAQLSMIIVFAKSFFRYGRCSINLNPPYSPFPKGGTDWNSFESPPLKKGDLGGFENLRTAGIYGNGYK